MVPPLFLLLIVGGARLSYIEATTGTSLYLRGRDSYNGVPKTINDFQNRMDVVEEARSGSAQWAQQQTSYVLTPVSSCGEGDSFTISGQKHGDLAGCYIKTGQHNGEEIYTFVNRMGRKYMVTAINFNETSTSPDVHWTLVRIDSRHNDIFCISLDFAYHTHPVNASWICDISPRGMILIAANPNDITFSCGCPPVTLGSLYKTAHHRRTTEDDVDAGVQSVTFIIIVGIFIRVLCHLLWRGASQQPPRVVERQVVLVRVPTRGARGVQCSSLAETARSTQASAIISSNEPPSEIEMMRRLCPPGGAANDPGDFPEEETMLVIPQ